MNDDAFQAVDLCNKCGFCQAGCPVYKVTGVEWAAARGRVALIKDYLDGRLALDEDMREPLFNCLTCNGCVDHCPPGVPTADIVNRARQDFLSRRGQSWTERFFLRQVLPRPTLLATATKALRFGQRSGAAALALRFSPPARDGLAILPPVPARAGYAALRRLVRPSTGSKLRVAYFAGCAAVNLLPKTAAAAIEVLQRQEAAVELPEFVCCGKPAESYGDLATAKAMAERNIDIAAKLPVDAIVTACATCSSSLKRYATLLKGAGRRAEQAKAFSAKVRDISELLVDIGFNRDMGKLPNTRVTWHDPCHLGRFQNLAGPPRQILRAIPGVELVELPEANMCCGGAGTYNVTHHEISLRILKRKMDNVARTGAGVLATSCPACAIQLSYGAREHRLPVRTVEIVELLAEAYQAP